MNIDWLHLIPMKLLVNTIDEGDSEEEENAIKVSGTFEKTHRKLNEAIAELEVSNFSSFFDCNFYVLFSLDPEIGILHPFADMPYKGHIQKRIKLKKSVDEDKEKI